MSTHTSNAPLPLWPLQSPAFTLPLKFSILRGHLHSHVPCPHLSSADTLNHMTTASSPLLTHTLIAQSPYASTLTGPLQPSGLSKHQHSFTYPMTAGAVQKSELTCPLPICVLEHSCTNMSSVLLASTGMCTHRSTAPLSL